MLAVLGIFIHMNDKFTKALSEQQTASLKAINDRDTQHQISMIRVIEMTSAEKKEMSAGLLDYAKRMFTAPADALQGLQQTETTAQPIDPIEEFQDSALLVGRVLQGEPEGTDKTADSEVSD